MSRVCHRTEVAVGSAIEIAITLSLIQQPWREAIVAVLLGKRAKQIVNRARMLVQVRPDHFSEFPRKVPRDAVAARGLHEAYAQEAAVHALNGRLAIAATEVEHVVVVWNVRAQVEKPFIQSRAFDALENIHDFAIGVSEAGVQQEFFGDKAHVVLQDQDALVRAIGYGFNKLAVASRAT